MIGRHRLQSSEPAIFRKSCAWFGCCCYAIAVLVAAVAAVAATVVFGFSWFLLMLVVAGNVATMLAAEFAAPLCSLVWHGCGAVCCAFHHQQQP